MATSGGPHPSPATSASCSNKTRPVKRSHSLLLHSRPPPVAKERASSLKREQSLKTPRDHYNLHLVSCLMVQCMYDTSGDKYELDRALERVSA